MKTTLRFLLLGMALTLGCFAEVKVTRAKDVVRVEIDGKPFTEYYHGIDVAKPYLAPVRAASGTIVTRQWPMVEGLAESTDHKHHRGLWFGYIDVNGNNFWENEFSYNRPNAGKIVVKSIDEAKGGKSGTIRVTSEWIDSKGANLLTQVETLVFRGDKDTREIDAEFVLTAKEKSVFGDDKDGVLGIRLVDVMAEAQDKTWPGDRTQSGMMVNSAGGKKMDAVWGKQADWIDYSGAIKGEKVGVAIFDHPSSFRHPTRWHSRAYGLFAVNPLGSQTFDKANPKSEVVLNPGEKMRFRYLVVIHPGLGADKIGEMYKSWAAKK